MVEATANFYPKIQGYTLSAFLIKHDGCKKQSILGQNGSLQALFFFNNFLVLNTCEFGMKKEGCKVAFESIAERFLEKKRDLVCSSISLE